MRSSLPCAALLVTLLVASTAHAQRVDPSVIAIAHDYESRDGEHIVVTAVAPALALARDYDDTVSGPAAAHRAIGPWSVGETVLAAIALRPRGRHHRRAELAMVELDGSVHHPPHAASEAPVTTITADPRVPAFPLLDVDGSVHRTPPAIAIARTPEAEPIVVVVRPSIDLPPMVVAPGTR